MVGLGEGSAAESKDQVTGTVLAAVSNLLYVSLGYELTLDIGSEN